ncbi:hypothetical protein [uncultured Sunxiuqinia sp.]|uniref:hypothetical protein n=1 Tax=uncultured Sunxiuqinia sp. TaxID=1573825 RepID=UPI002AA66764|nr:hypothetical protein [uncultured Sunxiuqinia sp.]
MGNKFNFSYGELAQRGDRMVVLMQQDASQLKSLGYTPEYTTEFQSKILFFKTLS